MATDDRIAALLHAATAEVPTAHRAVPAAAIRARAQHRRRTAIVAAAAAVVAVLAAGSVVTQRLLGGPAPQPSMVPASPTDVATALLPWNSAFVARDDVTVTVYTSGEHCQEALQPQVMVVAEDAEQVTIGIHTRVKLTVPCATTGSAVPFVVVLPSPLGNRTLVDATGGRPPAYFERHLPILRPDVWLPMSAGWGPADPVWVKGYNGPQGTSLTLGGQPGASGLPGVPVANVQLGRYEGAITGGPGSWSVWWPVGEAMYFLRHLPTEGDTMTLEAFEQVLAEMTWPR